MTHLPEREIPIMAVTHIIETNTKSFKVLKSILYGFYPYKMPRSFRGKK